MPVEYIKSITERYGQLGYVPYKWYEADDPPPWTPLKKPIAESRLGVLSTAGAYVAGQVAYYYKDDTSTRAVARDTPTSELRFSHITENYLPDARKDPNCVLPLEHLRTLEQEGVIGELPGEVFSCMGGIYSQRRVREELLPAMLKSFQDQEVDAALLLPL
jgi:D-proline reductase (dithiol) PrdB